MARSLQDQLMSAGLVDKKKAAQLEQEKRKQARQQPKPAKGQPPPRTRDPKAEEKAARDRELNLERQRQAERKALTAQIEQMVRQHRVSTAGADLDFRFVDRGVIKTIALTPAQHGAVVQGQLAIVRQRRIYALVPREIADKIAERDKDMVVVCNDGAGTEAADDADYAEFKVPDDLQW